MSDVELLLPDTLAPERLTSAVSSSGLTAESAGSYEGRRVYYDTFDGRLRAAGMPAVHEEGRLAMDGASVAAQQPPQRLLASELEPGRLRDALEPLIEVRALLPLAELKVSERRMRIVDSERKTVVRVSIERPTLVLAGSRPPAPLRSRLRLVAVRGYDAELDRVRAALERELGLEQPPAVLVDEAVRTLGGTPGGFSSKVEVELGFDQRADEAAVRVLGALFEVIERNLDGTIADLDSEFLHDLRVAVRRSRSVQRQLKGVFPPEALAHFRSEFKWLQTVTGDARDLDVYLLEFEDTRALVSKPLRPDLEPLREVLREHRAAARARMVDELRSERFERLHSGWSALLDSLLSLSTDDRPDAAIPIGTLAGRRIAKVYKRIVKEGRAIDEHGPPEPFHELRKRGKELRYLLELFASSVYPPDVVKPMVKALKGLQDVLGRHQDCEVQGAMLRALAGEISVLAPDPGPLLATGALIARLDDDKRAMRAAFGERFKAFSNKAQRAVVRDTFA